VLWIRITFPDADPDSSYHPDADPDSDFLFESYQNADPDPTFHPDADPDPDPSFKKRLKPLKKCYNRLIFHTFLLDICQLMRIRFWIQLINLMRVQMRIRIFN
jgi:hypothetical protein